MLMPTSRRRSPSTVNFATSCAQLLDFRFGQRLDLGRRIHARSDTDLLRPRAADTENTLQTDTDMLLDRQIDTCNARHVTISR